MIWSARFLSSFCLSGCMQMSEHSRMNCVPKREHEQIGLRQGRMKLNLEQRYYREKGMTFWGFKTLPYLNS
jgi:hypothetical protein